MSEAQRARDAIDTCVAELGLEATWRSLEDGREAVTVRLPGTNRLSTDCALVIGRQAVEVRAFVARHPDENHAAVYRWLLERNLKAYAVAFCVDVHGDIHLVGHLPLHAVTPEEVDRVLGSVAEIADGSFNTILELGFETSIRKEWQWRLSRGEPTANLEAFRHLSGQ